VRILLVSPYDLSVAGGVTSHVLEVASQLRSMGHQALVAGPANGSEPPDAFTHYIGGTFRIPTPGDNAFVNLNPFVVKTIEEFLAGQQFDVVHVHEPYLAFIGPTFLRQADAVKIGTFHATREGPHIPYALFQPFISRWSRLLDGRITVSETAKRTISRYFPDDYETIPNGIDFERFAGPRRETATYENRQPTILFVGRLEERKGVPFLLRAFARLRQRMPNVGLVIVGDGRRRKHYERLAAQLRLTDVSFKGFVPKADLPEYLRRASVVCQPSTCNESFGITILEAMAAGTPIVASDIPGFGDLVQSGVTGLAVPPKDEAALADALGLVINDHSLGKRLSDAAQSRAREYDWPRIATRLTAFYQKCFERTPSVDLGEPVGAYRFPA
jgi:phosphatidyl-myo-inositol alpha-mannosyltransferase